MKSRDMRSVNDEILYEIKKIQFKILTIEGAAARNKSMRNNNYE